MVSLLENILVSKAANPELLTTLSDPKNFTALIIDEPARYFYEESDKEYWDQRVEFKNVAPPFECMWLECRAPKFTRSEVKGVTPWDYRNWKRAGILLTAYENHPQQNRFYKARWVVEAEIFLEEDELITGIISESLKASLENLAHQEFGHIEPDVAQQEANVVWQKEMAKIPKVTNITKYVYGIEEDGTMAVGADAKGNPVETTAFYIYQSETSKEWCNMSLAFIELVSHVTTPVLDVALLSIYLMHASGTEIKPKHVPPKLKKAREKKRKVQVPEIKFKILDLGLGMRQSLKEAKEEGLGLSRALHLRRGHFKVFTKPMFGRGKTGSVWIRPHRVGSKEAGEITNVYKVPKPKDPEPPKRNFLRRFHRRNPSTWCTCRR